MSTSREKKVWHSFAVPVRHCGYSRKNRNRKPVFGVAELVGLLENETTEVVALMPNWAIALSSLLIALLFLLAVYALAASPCGDWVREFYAKRDRLQTLLGDKTKK